MSIDTGGAFRASVRKGFQLEDTSFDAVDQRKRGLLFQQCVGNIVIDVIELTNCLWQDLHTVLIQNAFSSRLTAHRERHTVHQYGGTPLQHR